VSLQDFGPVSDAFHYGGRPITTQYPLIEFCESQIGFDFACSFHTRHLGDA
jgi:hypothetical protein